MTIPIRDHFHEWITDTKVDRQFKSVLFQINYARKLLQEITCDVQLKIAIIIRPYLQSYFIASSFSNGL